MMSLLSFSQTDSIKKIVVGKDTGAFVPMGKVREINKIIIDLDECKETKDTLNGIIKNYDIAYTKLDSALVCKKMEVTKKDSVITSFERVVSDQEKLMKKKDLKVKMLKIQRNVLLPAVGILVAVLFFLSH